MIYSISRLCKTSVGILKILQITILQNIVKNCIIIFGMILMNGSVICLFSRVFYVQYEILVIIDTDYY